MLSIPWVWAKVNFILRKPGSKQDLLPSSPLSLLFLVIKTFGLERPMLTINMYLFVICITEICFSKVWGTEDFG